MSHWKRFAAAVFDSLHGAGSWARLSDATRARYEDAFLVEGERIFRAPSHQRALQPLFDLFHHHSADKARQLYAAQLQRYPTATVQAAVRRIVQTWQQPKVPPLAVLRTMCREATVEVDQAATGPRDPERAELAKEMCSLVAASMDTKLDPDARAEAATKLATLKAQICAEGAA